MSESVILDFPFICMFKIMKSCNFAKLWTTVNLTCIFWKAVSLGFSGTQQQFNGEWFSGERYSILLQFCLYAPAYLYILMLSLVKWLIPQNSKHGEQRHLLLVSASIQLFFFIHKSIIFACTSSSEHICFIFKWLLMVTLLSST